MVGSRGFGDITKMENLKQTNLGRLIFGFGTGLTLGLGFDYLVEAPTTLPYSSLDSTIYTIGSVAVDKLSGNDNTSTIANASATFAGAIVGQTIYYLMQ